MTKKPNLSVVCFSAFSAFTENTKFEQIGKQYFRIGKHTRFDRIKLVRPYAK